MSVTALYSKYDYGIASHSFEQVEARHLGRTQSEMRSLSDVLHMLSRYCVPRNGRYSMVDEKIIYI